MKAKIIAVTNELGKECTDLITDAKTFAGKMAGICYSKNDYFTSNKSSDEMSLKRFERIGDKHHSISDHFQITILFEGISKWTAMLLNSLGMYTTSERSARYTEMKGLDEKEDAIYHKWIDKFKYLIKTYSDVTDEKMINKLALENARYFISVYSECTTMAYTTSIRQWNYILDWCQNVKTDDNLILKQISNLYTTISSCGIFIEELHDLHEGRTFNKFIIGVPEEVFDGPSRYNWEYKRQYLASYAQVAQAQRHRTIEYYVMKFTRSEASAQFYIPKIVTEALVKGDDSYYNELLKDYNTLRDNVPQGTRIWVCEIGTWDDFKLKCRERLCNRAQQEIMRQTLDNLTEYIHHYITADEDIRSVYDLTNCKNCKEKCVKKVFDPFRKV